MASAEATPDLCVIGGSEAGLAACLGAVALGLTCVLVDDGDASGLRNADLTLAALAHAAADRRNHAGAWAEVSRALHHNASDRRHARFGALNVRLVRGTGRFIDSKTLRADDEHIRARRFFIATGGRQPGSRLAGGLAKGVCLSMADLGRLDHTPSDVLVLGGTVEAVSAAQSLARLGSRVTLAAEAILPDLDSELTAPLLIQMKRDGVAFVEGHLQLLRPSAGGVVVSLSDGSELEASHVLLVEQSEPALDRLDIQNAGLTAQGQLLVLDPTLRTNRRHIFAIGRAAGAHSTAAGVAQAGHALRAAFTPVPDRLRPEIVPIVTATYPQIGAVGQAVDAAQAQVWRWPLSQTGGGALLASTQGTVKIVTDRQGRIKQAGLVGPSVGELVPFWTLAIARGLTLSDLGEVVPPLPSLSESIRAIAVQDLGRRLASPWVRRALWATRWLG